MDFTVKNVVEQTVWIAPELLENEEYMEEWSKKYWGVGYNEVLNKDEEE